MAPGKNVRLGELTVPTLPWLLTGTLSIKPENNPILAYCALIIAAIQCINKLFAPNLVAAEHQFISDVA